MSMPDFQPKSFTFTEKNKAEIEKILAKYPKDRKASAVMPLLTLAQKQHDNWIPKVAMEEIANILSISKGRVLEVATFYTMYNLKPVGKHHIQVCTNLACWLRGSSDIIARFEKELGVKMGETTDEYTLSHVECAGACVNAPVVQIGVDYYEDLSADDVADIVADLKSGQMPKPGPRINRKGSEPLGEQAGLTEAPQAKEGGAV